MVSKEEFKEEVRRIAVEINVKPKRICVRSMKTKLGSCSQDRVLTFNESLLSSKNSLRLETIIHELLYLRYKNHGKMFKMMAKYYYELQDNL